MAHLLSRDIIETTIQMSVRALYHRLEDLLDKVYFVVEQGGLGYGSGNN